MPSASGKAEPNSGYLLFTEGQRGGQREADKLGRRVVPVQVWKVPGSDRGAVRMGAHPRLCRKFGGLDQQKVGKED